jgi:hypothetical protein
MLALHHNKAYCTAEQAARKLRCPIQGIEPLVRYGELREVDVGSLVIPARDVNVLLEQDAPLSASTSERRNSWPARDISEP